MSAEQVRTACFGIVLLCICGLIFLAPDEFPFAAKTPDFISQSK